MEKIILGGFALFCIQLAVCIASTILWAAIYAIAEKCKWRTLRNAAKGACSTLRLQWKALFIIMMAECSAAAIYFLITLIKGISDLL